MTFSTDIGPLNVSINADGITQSAAGAGDPESCFELRAGELQNGELRVRRFRGREALSETFRFSVEFYSDLEPGALRRTLLGLPTTLIFRRDMACRRVIHGVTARLNGGELRGEKHRLYRLQLVPRMWLLRRRRNTRIFQHKTVVEVIRAVLSEAGIQHHCKVERKLPPLPYCVQYKETDYEFVTRLMREAGFFFYFIPPENLDGNVEGGIRSAASAIGGAIGGALGGAIADAAASVVSSAVGGGSGGKNSKLAPGIQETLVIADAAESYPPIDAGSASASGEIAAGLGAAQVSASASVSVLGVQAGVSVSMDPQASSQWTVDAEASVQPAREGSPVLLFRPEGMIDEDHHVRTFDLERSVRSHSVTLDDYNFKHPLVDRVSHARVAANTTGHDDDHEVPALLGRHAFEIYEHERDFEEVEVRHRATQSVLEAHRSRAVRGSGSSRCLRLAPGHRFTLDEHPESGFNREFVVIEIEHEGDAGHQLDVGEVDSGAPHRTVYQNTFVCAPGHVPIRPRRRLRPVQQVVEVAVVTGPPGEEVFPDEFGRIKVQFPWDREGRNNEHSSCWIRVAQSWAGSTWGAQFVPRVGMEVLVTFLGGNPDRPVITGCLYNALNATPFTLPGDKTRTGWRTQTTPGGGGFNELSFEDAAGSEQLYLRAQRDLDELVLHDHTLTVKNDETNVIENDQKDTVGGDRVALVKGTETITVNTDQSLHVLGDRSEVVDGKLTTKSTGDESHDTTGGFNRTIGGDENREVGGSSTIAIQNSLTQTVEGNYTGSITGLSETLVEGQASATFGDDSIEQHAGHRTIIVGNSDTSRSTVLHVEGAARAYATDIIEAVSVKGFTLTCGTTVVNITPTGISFSAENVAFLSKAFDVSSDTIDAAGNKSASLSGPTVTVAGSAATAVFDGKATVTAPQIALTSGSAAGSSPTVAPPKVTTVTLVDQNGNPMANQRVVLRTGGPDGLERTVVLDATGAFQTTSTDPFEVRFADYPAASKA